jgi:uncharacterized protein
MSFLSSAAVELFALGAVVGILSAFFGLGGGILLVPVLPMVLPMKPVEATATSLLTILIVSLSNSWGFSKKKLIDWPNALWLGGTAGITSMLTAIEASRASDRTMHLAFGAAILVILFFVYFDRPRKLKAAAEPRHRGPGTWSALGAVCGLMSGGTGLGGGIVAGPLIMRLNLTPNDQVVPMISVIMIFSAGLGLAGYAISDPQWSGWAFGPIRLDAALVVFVGAQFTSLWGVRHQSKVPREFRRRMLLVFLTMLLGKVWWTVLYSVK